MPTPRRQLVHENVVKLLQMANALEKSESELKILWTAWLNSVASGLYLEHKFLDEFRAIQGRPQKKILYNLEGLAEVNEEDLDDICTWCAITYDTYHQLRFSVDTVDSIEVVKQYLHKSREQGIWLTNLLTLKSDREWKVNYKEY